MQSKKRIVYKDINVIYIIRLIDKLVQLNSFL